MNNIGVVIINVVNYLYVHD